MYHIPVYYLVDLAYILTSMSFQKTGLTTADTSAVDIAPPVHAITDAVICKMTDAPCPPTADATTSSTTEAATSPKTDVATPQQHTKIHHCRSQELAMFHHQKA